MRTVLGSAVLILCAAAAPGAEWKLERAEAALPEAVAAPLREALEPTAWRVSQGDDRVAELWLRKDLAAGEGQGPAGSNFAALGKGRLIGAIRFARGWTDFRSSKVAAGVYTLRYLVQPEDGNHMDVADHRDFLLLAAAADDPALAPPEKEEQLVERSAKVTGSSHPAVLALYPVRGESKAPRIGRNEHEHALLVLELGGRTAGLVIEGVAPALAEGK